MSFIPNVTCRRCGRQFSALRLRCPYCGTRRVRQSERVPASSGSADPGSPAGERAASNARWQLIFGGILLLAVILAVVVLVSISLNSSTKEPVTTFPSFTPVSETQTPPPPTIAPTPTPQVESVNIWVNGAATTGFTMAPRWNADGQTTVVSAVVFPNTITNAAEGVTWSSSDESVITVTPDSTNPLVCTLTQVGNGSSTVSVTVFGVTTSILVNAHSLEA